jgi:hypothetical protein
MTAFWHKFIDVSEMPTVVMKKAASISETPINLYRTTRRNHPEDSHLPTGHHENLKSLLFL